MILGSHNSWSWLPVNQCRLKPFAFMARCQRVDIRTQYERYDVRCFDLHIRFDRYGLLHLVHGMFEYDPVALTSDLRYLNSMGDCYVRVIHDVRTRKQFETSHKSRFEEYCYNLETAFTCIRFWCGKNLYNWEEDYRFEYDPSCEEKYASVCKPRLIDDWWPWLYAKLHNRKIHEKGTEKDILLIDYVNIK